MKNIKLAFILFLLFLAYRIYFWEDVFKHGLHNSINAFFDMTLALCCGYVIFVLYKKKVLRRGIVILSSIAVIGGSFILFGLHTLVYKYFGILDTDFAPMFYAVCFQLLDSLAIVIIGSMLFVLQSFFYEKKELQSKMKLMKVS